jgi:hypothetical protein
MKIDNSHLKQEILFCMMEQDYLNPKAIKEYLIAKETLEKEGFIGKLQARMLEDLFLIKVNEIINKIIGDKE